MTQGVSELYQTALLGGVARVCNIYLYLFISTMVTCMTLTVDRSVCLLWLSIVRSGLRLERDHYAKYIKNVNRQLKLKLERKLKLKRNR